jgi:hypothetical protein
MQALKRLPGRTRLVTVEPVITEACYVLAGFGPALERLRSIICWPSVEISSMSKERFNRAIEIVADYKDSKLDFADAVLMAMCEEYGLDTVFTLDRRDFELFRPKHLKRFKLIP